MTCVMYDGIEDIQFHITISSLSSIELDFSCSSSFPLILLIIVQFLIMLTALTERSGVVYGVKLYPAGATTNSQDGVTDLFGKCFPVLEEMAEHNMPLLVLI